MKDYKKYMKQFNLNHFNPDKHHKMKIMHKRQKKNSYKEHLHMIKEEEKNNKSHFP